MKLFIVNKLIPIILLPYRFIKIYVYKLYTIKIKLEADSNIIIVDKGIIKIKWEVENAYLVKLSNKGIVNNKGEFIIKNIELDETVKLTAFGYKKKTKYINFKKVELNWEKQITVKLKEKETELFVTNVELNFNTISVIDKHITYENKNIELQFDLTDIKNELQTITK